MIRRRVSVPASVIAGICVALLGAVCAARDVQTMRDTNELAWDKTFRSALGNFLGAGKADFYWPHGSLAQQVMAGLSGPPNEVRVVNANLWLASACRAHSCPEKAAVLIQPPMVIVAVGVVHFHCREEGKNVTCDKAATLTILTGKHADGDSVSALLETWARKESRIEQVERVTPRGLHP